MAAGRQFQQLSFILLLLQVQSCQAFGIPSIALYGIVAGGALFLVLLALLITLCVKKCRARKEVESSGKKKTSVTKVTDVEKGQGAKKSGAKTTGLFASSKKKSDGKSVTKDKVTKLKVKDETKEKGDKKDKVDTKKQKEDDKKKEKEDKKKEKEDKKKEKEDKKKEKEAKKAEEKKIKEDKKNKDKINNNKNDDKKKEPPATNKVADKWKTAVSKINTGRSGVAPAKSSKVAWTVPADSKKEAPKKPSFGFGKK